MFELIDIINKIIYTIVCIMMFVTPNEVCNRDIKAILNYYLGLWWLSYKFGAMRPEFRRLESHSSRHVGTFDSPSLAIAWSASAC